MLLSSNLKKDYLCSSRVLRGLGTPAMGGSAYLRNDRRSLSPEGAIMTIMTIISDDDDDDDDGRDDSIVLLPESCAPSPG